VSEPNVEDTISFCGLKDKYEQHHGAQIQQSSAPRRCASLHHRPFPALTAIDLIDEAAGG
jgi:ATP-dependent Clp protease ATP-binding subunit ClpA